MSIRYFCLRCGYVHAVDPEICRQNREYVEAAMSRPDPHWVPPPFEDEPPDKSEENLPSPGSAPAPIDYADLAQKLRNRRMNLPARLVEYMADKSSAKIADVAKHVHGNPRTSKNTVKQLLKRTNDALFKLGSRLHFSFRLGEVHRETAGRRPPGYVT